MKFLPLLLCLFLWSSQTVAQAPAESADVILKAAYKKAKKQKKNVFVIFHASWCGWCRKMDKAMQDESCKKFFDDNYITVHLVIQESAGKEHLNNPGADQFAKDNGGDRAGLPYWLILNPKGKVLTNANAKADNSSSNLGCPASEEEVATFIAKLKKTSKLNDEALEIIGTRFKKNNH